ncbi:MAG: tetratricopeptide repeat protein [Myxococcales bacterium]|nr:tetratricopeptide repeat protein [Myxococcales bacterium]
MQRARPHIAGLFIAAAVAVVVRFPARSAPPPPGGNAEAALEDMRREMGRFEEAARSFRSTMQHIVHRDYLDKRKELQQRYESVIKAEEAEERKARLAAIEQFEKFLAKYPNDTRWSPDVLFRLAELYFERSNEEYLAAVQAQQQGGKNPDQPIVPDYSRTIELYKRLLIQFPDYRLIDGAHYLLGYCLGEMSREAEARQAYLALVCSNKYKALDPPVPPQASKGRSSVDPYAGCVPIKEGSRFLPEAWIRIGEYHFDYNELDQAIFAYSQVLRFRNSPYFDKALYKLAWSYYRADRYMDAIKRFDELVVFSDRERSESGKEGSDLRAEAVQYLGISFAEKDWNGDGIDDSETGLERIEAFYRGREKEPHVREVYLRLGDIYFDQTEYLRATEVYRRVLARWPYAPDSPKVQDRIVLAFERLRNFDQALKEREALGRNYARGSQWYQKNRDNREALAQAAELAEASMISAAVNHHKAAQEYKALGVAKKDARLLELAAREYRLASEAYETYLKQYPNSKNAYEYGYYYAETLYYSQRFEEAARAYEKIRDSQVDNRYMEDAAFNTIKAYEQLIEQQVKAGKLVEPPLPQPGKVKAPVAPLPVPELWRRLQAAYDAFVAKLPASGRTPTIAYKAAEIDYRHLNFEAARPRMAQIIERYCKDDRAVDAGNAILVSYTIENNLERLEEWTTRLKEKKCGSSTLAAAQQGELKKLSDDVRFSKAQRLFEEKKYEEAAALFVQLVDSDPRSQNADKALNNAAVAYENVHRYAAATRLYERIVRDYPQSAFVDDALFRTAVNYQRFFEFDQAALAYQTLATDPRFKGSSHRTDALFNAAVILENDQNYARAAELFRQYAQNPAVKKEDAADAYFRAALAIEKMKDPERAEREFIQYIRRFGGEGRNLPRVVEASFRIAQAREARRDREGALKFYRQVVKLGGSLEPGSEGAEYVARAAFLLAEARLGELEKMKISGGGKALLASMAAFEKRVAELVAEYNKVLAYKRANWTLAAYFRTGYLFEVYAKALLNAPCPPEVKRLGVEACDVYRNQIEEKVSSVEDEAVKRYEITLEQAGKLGVANEWTRLARQKANAYRPEKFPLVKDERVDMQLDRERTEVRAARQGSGGDPIPLTVEAQALLGQGRYEDAIRIAKLALQRDEKYVPAMIVLAKAYFYLKKFELAASIVEIAKSIDDRNADAYNLLGFIALQRDDRIAATAAFKKAVEVESDFAVGWNNLCAQYIVAKNYELAISACSRATSLAPGLAKAHLNLGSALRGVRRYADAERAYRQALQIDPNYADGFFNLGILYLDAKDMPGVDPVTRLGVAVQHLSRYKELAGFRLGKDDPVDQYIKEARDAMEREQRRQKRGQPKGPHGSREEKTP